MAAKPLPEAEYLRECFKYDPVSGSLKWQIRPRSHFTTNRSWRTSNVRFAGKESGIPNPKNGYVQVFVAGRRCYKHRVIWKIVTGKEAPNEIDHENKDRSDYSWNNLRSATRVQNMANVRSKPNRFGLRGVHQTRLGDKFNARIKLGTRRVYLGTFDTAEEAHEAYCRAGKQYHGEFWNPG
jgi:hypothetical protein